MEGKDCSKKIKQEPNKHKKRGLRQIKLKIY
jgi:hypothetical protein